MLKKLFFNTFNEVENEKEEYCRSHTSVDKKVIIVCILTAFCLSMIHYFGHYDFARAVFSDAGATEFVKKADKFIYGSFSNLRDLCYWATLVFVFYFIVPALTVKLIFKEQLSNYGLKLKGAFKDYYLYIFMLLVMIPLVAYFSTTKSFQDRYPFLSINNGDALFPNLLIWELFYCLQFFALEFFFRGFVLFGLKNRFGFYSIFMMTIPYCMIHFGKPLPETIAAIIAGIVLGFLALKNKSVYLGFLIHISVGLGMDIAALYQKGFFN